MVEISPETWLRREVLDLLDAGTVGLYELIWCLNSSEFDLDDAEKLEIAQQVATDLIEHGTANLYMISWPNDQVIAGPLGTDAMRVLDSWKGDRGSEYLALDLVDGADA